MVLEQRDALLLYFQSQSKTDRVNWATIYKTMSNVETKHMHIFINHVLKKFNTLNIAFQYEHFRLYVLQLMVSTEYKNI